MDGGGNYPFFKSSGFLLFFTTHKHTRIHCHIAVFFFTIAAIVPAKYRRISRKNIFKGDDVLGFLAKRSQSFLLPLT